MSRVETGFGRRGADGSPGHVVRFHPRSALAALLIAASILAPGAAAADPGSELDWTIGLWEGVRRDGESGKEDRMTMRVEAILGGTGQIRQIEIPHDRGVYRGFAVQVFDEARGRWIRQYTNEGRGRFSTLEGEVSGDRSTWRITSSERTRESRLISERLDGGRWRRTMSVSTDGGGSWTVLWIDDLRRVIDETPPPMDIPRSEEGG